MVVNSWVEATTWYDASDRTQKIAAHLGQPFGGVVTEARMRTEERVDAELAQPTIPTLLGASEVAVELGVSRQRVHQLHRDHPDFPAPLVEVAMGPLWDQQGIARFARDWQRKPGRPAKLAG